MKQIIIFPFLFITILSSYSQEMSMLDYFSLLPSEAFDFTSEGISNQEKKELIHNGLTGMWKVAENTTTNIKISGGDQLVTLQLVKTNDYPILIVYTVNAQVRLIHTWVYNSENEALNKEDLLPYVSINDFYSNEDALSNPERFNGNVSFYLNNESKIEASLYTWMEPKLENKSIKFNIYIEWIRGKFIINKQLK